MSEERTPFLDFLARLGRPEQQSDQGHRSIPLLTGNVSHESRQRLNIETPVQLVPIGLMREKRPRGRPRGTGHPKRRAVPKIPITELDRSKLRKRGLTDRQIKTLYLWVNKGKQVAVAKELGITAQAVNKQLKTIFRRLHGNNWKSPYRAVSNQVK